MSSLAVVGAGAWGTALAIQAARAGNQVLLWARDPAKPARFPLPHGVALTGDLPADGLDAMLLAVPVQHLRSVLQRIRPQAPAVLCAKGIESGTGLLPLEVLHALHPGVPGAVLTGPNFAHEVAAGLPAAAVLAGPEALRTRLLPLLGTAAFRLYGNDDALGAQLGGAAKNVVAIAAGAVTGAGLGENARAALITRGVAELARLVAAQGGRAETASGLSGLGDLLLTCTGPSSRNFALGLRLGQGATLPEALAAARGVVEGVPTAPALLRRAAGLDLPVCAAVAAVLAGTLGVRDAMARLLDRPLRDE